jgi:hypothetical protein
MPVYLLPLNRVTIVDQVCSAYLTLLAVEEPNSVKRTPIIHTYASDRYTWIRKQSLSDDHVLN